VTKEKRRAVVAVAAANEWDPPSQSLRRDRLYGTNETYGTLAGDNAGNAGIDQSPFTFQLSSPPLTHFSLLTSHVCSRGMTGWLSSSVGGQVRFETTQWSLVSAASDEQEKLGALSGLYRSYCTPVYFFIRRRGYSREDAQDLTQDFFLHLVEKNAFSRADPSRGKFRTFLLGALEFFLQHAAERARS